MQIPYLGSFSGRLSGQQPGRCFKKKTLKKYLYSPVKGHSLTKEELICFGKIFKMLANDSLLTLTWNQSKIASLQERVKHVHPLNFLEAAYHSPGLKKPFKGLVKRGGMVFLKCIHGLREEMRVEERRDNFQRHLRHFSKQINLKENPLNSGLFEGDLGRLVKIVTH